jgi:TonB family protein
VQPEFHEEITPPPRQPQPKAAAPIKAPQVAARPGLTSISNAKASAVFAPKPEYPYEARSRRVTGSGVCVVTVDPGSGSVTDATMAQSIGSPILDNATVSGFRRWRFKPGTVSKVKIPITFTMTGASY